MAERGMEPITPMMYMLASLRQIGEITANKNLNKKNFYFIAIKYYQ
jgi:hypothetical protein